MLEEMGPGEEGYMEGQTGEKRAADVCVHTAVCTCLCFSNIKSNQLVNIRVHALIQAWRSVGNLWELVLSSHLVSSRDQIHLPSGFGGLFPC